MCMKSVAPTSAISTLCTVYTDPTNWTSLPTCALEDGVCSVNREGTVDPGPRGTFRQYVCAIERLALDQCSPRGKHEVSVRLHHVSDRPWWMIGDEGGRKVRFNLPSKL